jgi:carbon storage regulator
MKVIPEHTRTKGISAMLVLSRKQSQSIVINGNIRITVVSIRGNQVRIGIEAPDSVAVFREELCDPFPERMDKPRLAAAGAAGRQVTPGSNDPLRRAPAPQSMKR